MKAFFLEYTWVLPLCALGVSILWTLFQWKTKLAEQRTVLAQIEVAKEHRITVAEGRIDSHEGRLSSLEARR